MSVVKVSFSGNTRGEVTVLQRDADGIATELTFGERLRGYAVEEHAGVMESVVMEGSSFRSSREDFGQCPRSRAHGC